MVKLHKSWTSPDPPYLAGLPIQSAEKPQERASSILVTLTSRSGSDFERSNISLKISRMVLIRTLMTLTTAFEGTKEKFCGFRQTVLTSVVEIATNTNFIIS